MIDRSKNPGERQATSEPRIEADPPHEEDGGQASEEGSEPAGTNGLTRLRDLDRRLVLSGAAGTAGLAGAGLYAWSRRGSEGTTARIPPDRKAAYTPADAGGFTSREESFVADKEADKTRADGRKVWDTPDEAARNTEVTVSTVLATDDPVLHLLRRTTFGPTPELVLEAHDKGIDAWLDEQLKPETLADEEADRVWGMYPLASATPAQIQGEIEDHDWQAMTDYGKATLSRQIWSRRQLFEVMVDLWANHLNVATPGGANVWDVAPAYHNDVIRRHALGSFTDMLLAANRHPGMLRYLNNDQSNKDSVNENLGRELLELHTVGVGSGYTEDDVRNSAYILTGRSVGRGGDDDRGPQGSFVYDPDKHWVGPVQVLDFRHDNSSAEGGLEVGDGYLRYLASHPATARTIARKLAVRFVSDSPPDELVDRLATQYLESETEIVPVLDLLFRSSELWAAVGQKIRRPLENAVASFRVLDVRPGGGDTIDALDGFYGWTRNTGHQPLAWRPPNGYPDVYQPWRSASGMLELWNVHRRLVRGNLEGVVYTAVDQLIGGQAQGTVGEYVDALCQRLCFQTFQPEHRDALIAFTGAGEAAPSAQADLDKDYMVGHLAPLVLDSPYFALR